MQENITIARIKEAMRIRNMNQLRVSEKAGVTVGALSSYLSGHYKPKREQVAKIAEALDVSYLWLLGLDDNMEGGKVNSMIKIPFVDQKISAGFLQEFLSSDDIFPTKSISVTRKMVALYPEDSLVAAEVSGDSMVDAGIDDGDYVIFSKGTIKGNGIYVLALDGIVMVKRLFFDPVEKTIDIISDNKAYKPLKVSAEMDGLVILGKVAGCIHAI